MKRKFTLLLIFLSTYFELAFAQVSADYAVQLTASLSASPPSITLHWNQYQGALSYLIYRKPEGSFAWGIPIATLSPDSSSYTDTNVALDSLYEYRVLRNGNGISADGYITSAIMLHPQEYNGILLLLVDASIADSLQSELYRLMKDISNEGWSIKRIDVSPTDSVSAVKALIEAEYNANPELKSLLLFGHVPVPYSGELNPDGHPDHLGAWPADGYYGEMDGDWTDDYVDISTASRPENWNTPGDGKFDNTNFPDYIDLEIGRVDLYDLPSFTSSEIQLYRQYLNKDHDYRTGNLVVQPRGLIDDNFGAFGGEAFASCGWRNFIPLLGDSSINEADYFTTLSQTSYLWSYGCGGGWYQGAGGVGSTTDFANDSVKTVFTMLFGSYFGDWDNSDNFLRAPLASKGYTLTNCWAGRPYWFFHYMGLGKNIGYCAKLTQNNSYTYTANYGTYWVHIALMGDPTLRMNIIKPAANLELAQNLGDQAVGLYWDASPDNVLGYYIYRSTSEFGKYERVSDTIVTAQPFIDYPDSTSTYYYMVRAIRLELTPGGSYYNLSPGISDSIHVVVTGLQDPSMVNKSFLNIFPNPATNLLVVLSGNNFWEDILISDVSGKIWFRQDKSEDTHEVLQVSGIDFHLSIDVASLPRGIYFIRVGNEVRKFVKM